MKKATVVVLVLLLALLVGVYLYLDRIAESVIEDSSQEALGVETEIEAASLNLWTGALGMSQFAAHNPPGTAEEEPYFFSIQEGRLRVPPSVLWRDTVNVPEITLTGLVFNLEQDGLSSNYRPILNHLSAYLAADPDAQPTLIVDEMHIRSATVNLSVSASAAGLSGDAAALQATVPALHLRNVGAEEGGVSPGRLMALVITSVLQTVAESEEALPDVVREILLAHLDELPRVPVQVEGEIASTGPEDVRAQIEEALRKRIEEVLEEGEDLRDRVLDRARDVLGRDTTN